MASEPRTYIIHIGCVYHARFCRQLKSLGVKYESWDTANAASLGRDRFYREQKGARGTAAGCAPCLRGANRCSSVEEGRHQGSDCYQVRTALAGVPADRMLARSS